MPWIHCNFFYSWISATLQFLSKRQPFSATLSIKNGSVPFLKWPSLIAANLLRAIILYLSKRHQQLTLTIVIFIFSRFFSRICWITREFLSGINLVGAACLWPSSGNLIFLLDRALRVFTRTLSPAKCRQHSKRSPVFFILFAYFTITWKVYADTAYLSEIHCTAFTLSLDSFLHRFPPDREVTFRPRITLRPKLGKTEGRK